jgi:hypothetical protein
MADMPRDEKSPDGLDDADALRIHEILKAINDSVLNGLPVERLKAQLISEQGSLENVSASLVRLRRLPEVRSELMSDLQDSQELVRQLDDLRRQIFGQVIADLADIDRWRELAKRDPQAYRKELGKILVGIKAALNRMCGVESHRPRKNDERDEFIYKLKSAKPELSFGQIALEYNKRRSGKAITSKVAERSYSRHAARVKAEMESWLFAFFRLDAALLPALQKLHKTL